MSYQCLKPQCGREVHPHDYQPNQRCVCGALIGAQLNVQLKLFSGGELKLTQPLELQRPLRVGRGLFFCDLDISPYLTRDKSVSRHHLTLYIKEDLIARVSLDSQKRALMLNRSLMRPGEPPRELPLPLELRLSSELTLLVERA